MESGFRVQRYTFFLSGAAYRQKDEPFGTLWLPCRTEACRASFGSAPDLCRASAQKCRASANFCRASAQNLRALKKAGEDARLLLPVWWQRLCGRVCDAPPAVMRRPCGKRLVLVLVLLQILARESLAVDGMPGVDDVGEDKWNEDGHPRHDGQREGARTAV